MSERSDLMAALSAAVESLLADKRFQPPNTDRVFNPDTEYDEDRPDEGMWYPRHWVLVVGWENLEARSEDRWTTVSTRYSPDGQPAYVTHGLLSSHLDE